ncbi:unnamed protein product [Closterium sp. NIES-64]|nr:unnamed protein product [Closterium sp. NIES-64]CAI5950058.1 unnamed protein product [Closterium sp. NIES-65]CAI5971005.1 unnamed protein product [Closterium sp. NIES-64]CAI5986846.1 unnamed protein product [Closterium sp. NIES-65]
MEQSSGNENSGPANTTPNTSVPTTSTQPDPDAAAPETQESHIQNPTPANAQTPTTTTNAQVDWRVFHIPSPTASYDADDDYGLGADMDNAATLGEVEEELAEQEMSPTRETTAPSRRSTGRTQPRWTPEEECEVLAAFISRQAQICARTGQQGRSWYPLIQEELLLQNPAWRHDISALKAKYNRMKEQWRRINDRIKRSGAGRATGLPPWFHLGDALWDHADWSGGAHISNSQSPARVTCTFPCSRQCNPPREYVPSIARHHPVGVSYCRRDGIRCDDGCLDPWSSPSRGSARVV